jgi:hypothetical protein
MVGMFVCLCLTSKKPSKRECFVPAGTDLGVKLLRQICTWSTSFCLLSSDQKEVCMSLWRFDLAARTFGVENIQFSNPTLLDKQSKKSTLNANWIYTLFIPFLCSSAFVLLVFIIIVTLCIAFQGAMSFSSTAKPFWNCYLSLKFCLERWVHAEGRGGLLSARVQDNGEGKPTHDVCLCWRVGWWYGYGSLKIRAMNLRFWPIL